MVKRRSLKLISYALTLAVAVILAWLVTLYAGHGSVSFRCGRLATAAEPYLDGSNHLFQRCDWHLGTGTRTWGETYGLKIHRVYLSMEVSHTNPRISPGEAREDL